MTTEQILEDAEIAAMYFRSLCDKGIPAFHAVSLTASYVQTCVAMRVSEKQPPEPWEGV